MREADAERRLLVYALCAACAVAAVAIGARLLGVTLCPLRRFLGIPCPTCGTTRAVAALFRGNVREALALNPLTATLLCIGPPLLGVHALVRGVAATRSLLQRLSGNRLFWWAVALLAAANWAYLLTKAVAE